MQSKRIAHLIGIADYHESISKLPVTHRDCEALAVVLAESGYEISKRLCLDSDLGRNGLEDLLIKACADAPAGAEVLLFFSGHGLHLEGTDYLVPKDARYRDQISFTRQLVPASLTAHVRGSKAASITCILDACRDDFSPDRKALPGGEKAIGSDGETTPPLPGETALLTVFSCAAGQYSRFEPSADGLSHFTKALCEVLSVAHPAETLKEVLLATQNTLDALTKAADHPDQTIHWRVEMTAGGGDPLNLRLCDGPGKPLRDAHNSSPWSREVRSFLEARNLWTAPVSEFLIEQVVAVAAACWLRAQQAYEAFPANRWHDENFPLRTLRNLRQLVETSAPRPEINAAEAALLAAAPFVHEAIWGNALSYVATTARPLDDNESGQADGARGSLERLWQALPQWGRKRERLKLTGRNEAADDVACWLVAVLLAREPDVWRMAADGGWLPADLIAEISPPETADPLNRDILTVDRLLRLARCLHADQPTLRRRAVEGQLDDATKVGHLPEHPLHERRIAVLLALASGMALDMRRLSPVLADHLGLGDPVTPADVQHLVDRACWRGEGHGLSLSVECDHPALDFAVAEQTQWLNGFRQAIVPEIETEAAPLAALKGLPARFGCGLVRIKDNAFSRPHLRFELAQDEVRELLMGEQLYGDPALAIREMYQNALDACRYRWAREQYLERINTSPRSRPKYQGEIRFEQGIHDGRPYLDCIDNGIGMAMEHLKGCFATAGRRFADTSEFIEERSRWRSAGIEFYPNSQFGVGVLSYFMLADEIEVETCRLDQNGNPTHRILARISGSGSLFRVIDQGAATITDIGTRIRLYLNKVEGARGGRISCVGTLRKLLVVAEFPTVARDGNETEEWQPGVPREQGGARFIPTAHSDLWWAIPAHPAADCQNPRTYGGWLADGIKTPLRRARRKSNNSLVLINLTGRRRPELSVDRTEIQAADASWVAAEMRRQESIDALAKYSLPLTWLSFLAEKNISVAEAVFESLCQQDQGIVINAHGKKCKASDIGYTAIDRAILAGKSNIKFTTLHRNRISALQRHGVTLTPRVLSRGGMAHHEHIPHFLSPLDGFILSEAPRVLSSDGTIEIGLALRISAKTGCRLAQVCSRLSLLSGVPTENSIIPPQLADYVAAEGDDILVHRPLDAPWQLLIVPGMNWGRLERLRQLKSLRTTPLPELRLEQQEAMERVARSWWKKSISITHKKDEFVVAALHALANSEEEEQLVIFRDLITLDFNHPAPNRALDAIDAALLTQDLDGHHPAQWPLFPASHIAKAVEKLKLSESDIRRRLATFVPFGAIVEE